MAAATFAQTVAIDKRVNFGALNLQAVASQFTPATLLLMTRALIGLGADTADLKAAYALPDEDIRSLQRRVRDGKLVDIALRREALEIAQQGAARVTSNGREALEATLRRIQRMSAPDEDCEFCAGRGYYAHPKSGIAIDCKCCKLFNPKDIMLLHKEINTAYYRYLDFLREMGLLQPVKQVQTDGRTTFQRMLDEMSPAERKTYIDTGVLPERYQVEPVPVGADDPDNPGRRGAVGVEAGSAAAALVEGVTFEGGEEEDEEDGDDLFDEDDDADGAAEELDEDGLGDE